MFPRKAILGGLALLGLTALSTGGATITASSTAPTSASISQPDFSAAAFNGGQDFSDNAGPPGQTFTPATNLTLSGLTVKGFANTGASFSNPLTATFTITISQVSGTTLTNLDQETTPSTTITDGSSYLTFGLATPVSLTAGSQYAYSLFSSTGYFGFAKSTADVYAGGAAIQQGGASRTAASGATVTNIQTDDRTFFINPTPEPGSLALLGLAGLSLLARRRA